MEVIYATEKAEKFVKNLYERDSARISKFIDLLERLGHELRMPFSKSLGQGLFELRIVGATSIRLIYSFYANSAYVLHVFKKKGQTISKKDLDYAKKMHDDLLV